MRIERLRLSNYRGFAELDLEFPKHGTTVLVGNNGAGKTSILDAIGTLLQRLIRELRWSGVMGEKLSYSDVRLDSKLCIVELSAALPMGDAQPGNFTWHASLPKDQGEESQARRFKQALGVFRDPSYSSPFLGHFSVERTLHGDVSTWLSLQGGPDEGSDGTESPITTEYSDFVRWFFDRENLENEQIREEPTFRDPELSVVRSGVERFCEGFTNLRIRRARSSMPTIGLRHTRSSTTFIVDKLVNGRKRVFELDQLSHGERGLLALVGIIARPLAMLNANRADPLDGPGVVLIDEIELHLHPGWQRDIIPRLERTFPNVQFIVTTHSPQVLSQLRPENIKIIEDFKLVERTPPTYGRDSNAILEDVMGVSERPLFATEKLAEVAALIDDENWGAARDRLHELARDLGTLDAEVVRLRTMIDMLDDARDAAK